MNPTDFRFTLGQRPDGAPNHLALSSLVGQHACIVANSGGGKSGLIRLLLEATHGQVQHIVLDAEDEFYTLREGFEYVIAGGSNGDLPISVEGAGGLALAALRHGFSLIVQLNDLPDRAAFVGAFLDALVNAPQDLWHPALVVIDEAQRFAPQEGNTAASKAVRGLLERGRKRGFTAVLASQRMAKIDKSVTGDVNNWFLGRVGQSTDRRVVADALGFGPTSAEARGLQSLPPRTFYAFGPAVSNVPELFRVGDVQTTPVRAGQTKVVTPPAPAALRDILQSLAHLPTPAGNEPAPDKSQGNLELQSRVARLEADLRKQREEFDAIRAGLRGAFSRTKRALEETVEASNQLELLLIGGDVATPSGPPNRKEHGLPPSLAKQLGRGEDPAPPPASTSTKPTNTRTAILAVLAAQHPKPRTKAQIALQAGYSAKGGGFNNAASKLRTEGFITGSDPLAITAAGLKEAGDVKPMPTGKALVDFWCGQLPRMAA